MGAVMGGWVEEDGWRKGERGGGVWRVGGRAGRWRGRGGRGGAGGAERSAKARMRGALSRRTLHPWNRI